MSGCISVCVRALTNLFFSPRKQQSSSISPTTNVTVLSRGAALVPLTVHCTPSSPSSFRTSPLSSRSLFPSPPPNPLSYRPGVCHTPLSVLFLGSIAFVAPRPASFAADIMGKKLYFFQFFIVHKDNSEVSL